MSTDEDPHQHTVAACVNKKKPLLALLEHAACIAQGKTSLISTMEFIYLHVVNIKPLKLFVLSMQSLRVCIILLGWENKLQLSARAMNARQTWNQAVCLRAVLTTLPWLRGADTSHIPLVLNLATFQRRFWNQKPVPVQLSHRIDFQIPHAKLLQNTFPYKLKGIHITYIPRA